MHRPVGVGDLDRVADALADLVEQTWPERDLARRSAERARAASTICGSPLTVVSSDTAAGTPSTLTSAIAIDATPTSATPRIGDQVVECLRHRPAR